MIELIRSTTPESDLDVRLAALHKSDTSAAQFALSYSYSQTYLPGAPAVDLLALVDARQTGDGLKLSVAITDQVTAVLPLLSTAGNIAAAAAEAGLVWFHLHDPLLLDPVFIAKPWGREIWFTGIEARGQSWVRAGDGRLPLPWLMSLCPRRLLAADASDIVLLKILDPLPEPVFGDLYFELHELKQEVYVVTHIDERAWPDGVGGIRFGFDPVKRRAYANDQAFACAYLEAVQRYREVRVAIDELLDRERERNRVPLTAPVDADQVRAWLQSVPADLLAAEAEHRTAMDAFAALRPLQVGDVVKVPLCTPHSLLHGVRTIEFQTPVYERKILSFAQKVLTQDHWDTEAALALADFNVPSHTELDVLMANEDMRREAVVRFADFEVDRLTLKPGAVCEISSKPYTVAMVVSGNAQLGCQTLGAEHAALITGLAGDLCVRNANGSTQAIVLLARPAV